MALATKEIQTLRLLLRSPDRGEGWRSVSEACWPIIESFGEPELLEIDKENMRVRLTDEGEIAVRYAL